MPTFAKIPMEVKAIGAIAIDRYAVFCKGLLTAGAVVMKLQKAEKKGLPAVGYLIHKGQKIYYCRYGFINDKDIYSK
jgi:hypothetical protein